MLHFALCMARSINANIKVIRNSVKGDATVGQQCVKAPPVVVYPLFQCNVVFIRFVVGVVHYVFGYDVQQQEQLAWHVFFLIAYVFEGGSIGPVVFYKLLYYRVVLSVLA